MGFGWKFMFGLANKIGGDAVRFYLSSLGITTPLATPTYTGASSGRYVPDEEGIFVAQAGLVIRAHHANRPASL